MLSFNDVISNHPWLDIQERMGERTEEQVKRALAAKQLDLDGFISLISPAAETFIEEMAAASHSLTAQRFGLTMGLYAPLYLSSTCSNACVYCSYNVKNPVERVTLSPEEAEEEARHLYDQGFRHILLVSGEDPRTVSLEYLSEVADRLRPMFDSISIEIYPMETGEYGKLIEKGVDGLIVYQETYDPATYSTVHPAGKKRDYSYRLDTPERGGQAGFRRVGIGALLGLSEWRTETAYLALHARYLMRRFWKSHITISFPRLRPAVGGYQPAHPVTDRNLVQMICALRLFLPDAGLILSTRESAELRDNLMPLGITTMSAGSKTSPGGYTTSEENTGQFEIADHRTPAQVAEVITQFGYEPVWKDWDSAFLSSK
jgi:2-iminoacetate synthase